MKSLRDIFLGQRLRVWIMLAGVVVALFCFEEVMDDVFQDPKEGDFEAQVFDRSISEYVSGLRSDRLTQIMTDITALGSVSVILALFVIFASVLVSFRDLKGVGFISIVLIGAGSWPPILKHYFGRVRPVETAWLVNVTDLSFPSGHSFGAAAAYIGFSYYASQYARTWTSEVFFFFLGALLAALVGVSRIYLGVHFPTDVLAGLSGGVAWGLFASAVYEMLVGSKQRFSNRFG